MRRLSKKIKNAARRAVVKYKVFLCRINNKPIRLNIGAGSHRHNGWIATDLPSLDITKEEDWARYFLPNSIDMILAEHVFEHLTLMQAKTALALIYVYLKPGASFRIAVPDGYHPSRYFIDLVRPGGLEHGSEDHKVLYNIDTLKELGVGSGLTVRPIEYFTETGVFVAQNYDENQGYVARTARNFRGSFTEDPKEMQKLLESTPEELRMQFLEKKISYTSLLIDLVKEGGVQGVNN